MRTAETARTENWTKSPPFSWLLLLLVLVELVEVVDLWEAGLLQSSESQQHTVISEFGNWLMSCL